MFNGTIAITPIPTDRWDNDRYYHPDPDTPGRSYARHGGFIHNVRGFDCFEELTTDLI